MFFDLPPAGFLHKAFVGARAWTREKSTPRPIRQPSIPIALGKVQVPGKTFDGFTLVMAASMSAPSTQAFLLDMRGDRVHTWSIPFSDVWPDPPHVQGFTKDSRVCFFGSHLYANGDLLVVFHGLNNEANGYGLAKLDKDSKVIWKYAANIHHDVDVGEDGAIYAVKHANVTELPRGLDFLPIPSLVDYLVQLSPDGKELEPPISILEAFQHSPYSSLLSSRIGMPPGTPGFHGLDNGDILHTNCVRVLKRDLAGKFPMLKAGQVLISVRQLDTIAALDIKKRAVVWAVRGPWRAQHDSQFLDNGHLLLFDNLGSTRGSRVLEFDPQSQAISWSYVSEDSPSFVSSERGMCQRLPNGNTLIVDSEGGKMLEVTHDKKLVWTCFCRGFITTARRYDPNYLQFLKGEQRARP